MEWIKIFSTPEEASHRIPEDKPQLLIVGEKRICLVRHNNQFSAVQDNCPHNGESLSKGRVNYLGEIICPWHGQCFELLTGREIQGRSPDLEIYPVKADDTGFFIGI
jgi:nitrite reductase/ring-hydroxylating ferredoxin subunit